LGTVFCARNAITGYTTDLTRYVKSFGMSNHGGNHSPPFPAGSSMCPSHYSGQAAPMLKAQAAMMILLILQATLGHILNYVLPSVAIQAVTHN
jgi:hypothetical protein